MTRQPTDQRGPDTSERAAGSSASMTPAPGGGVKQQAFDAVPLSRVRMVEERLREDGEVRVSLLARELGVSEMTIRRDLSALEERGVAKRSHGGAVLIDSSFFDPEFVDRKQQRVTAKRRIAQRCAELLPTEGSLFVGGGTTTCEVVRFLRDRPGLEIFTSNLAAASQARSGGTRMSVLGGTVEGPTCALVGALARASLSLLWADTLVIGADALSAASGVTSHSSAEADVARLMAERTRGSVVCVADSTKWLAAADHVILPAAALSMIVTDAVPDSERLRLEDLGVQISVV
jgi:DeoR/GlpR family transcriptional regulator of sugar metabolism